MKLTSDDIEWLDRIGVDDKRMKIIVTNQRLREQIVDLADIWDGSESWHYGQRLQAILNKLGIDDVPEFYKKENIDKLIKQMKKRREK